MVAPVNRQPMQTMLAEMQSMQAAASATKQGMQVQPSASFSEMLMQALSSANEAQMSAESLQTRHELGDKDADLVSVMLATQKANVSFQTMIQVRNRMLNAYREVMNMPM